MAGLGLRAPPDATASATGSAAPASTPTTEVIHTTANHPWLSADHGWLLAGDLHLGEPVRLLDGGTARVVALRALPGVGPMWDLSLDRVHTFAVGVTQAVVHNCDLAGNADGVPGNAANKVPGQPNLYYGQAADTDSLSAAKWRMTDTTGLTKGNTSDPSFEYLRSRYPNESPMNWKYTMETWESPDGRSTIWNHYWQNPFDHPGEYYHHH